MIATAVAEMQPDGVAADAGKLRLLAMLALRIALDAALAFAEDCCYCCSCK